MNFSAIHMGEARTRTEYIDSLYLLELALQDALIAILGDRLQVVEAASIWTEQLYDFDPDDTASADGRWASYTGRTPTPTGTASTTTARGDHQTPPKSQRSRPESASRPIS